MPLCIKIIMSPFSLVVVRSADGDVYTVSAVVVVLCRCCAVVCNVSADNHQFSTALETFQAETNFYIQSGINCSVFPSENLLHKNKHFVLKR